MSGVSSLSVAALRPESDWDIEEYISDPKPIVPFPQVLMRRLIQGTMTDFFNFLWQKAVIPSLPRV